MENNIIFTYYKMKTLTLLEWSLIPWDYKDFGTTGYGLRTWLKIKGKLIEIKVMGVNEK